MNELFHQLTTAPRDAIYLLVMALGAFLAAALIQVPTPLDALRSLLWGLFGGLLLVLLVTGYFDKWQVRYLAATSGLCGLLGNWVVNLILNNRDDAGKVVVRYAGRAFQSYLNKRFGGDSVDTDKQPPKS